MNLYIMALLPLNFLTKYCNYKISSNLKQTINKNIQYEHYDFDFTDEEVVELLVKNNADKSIVKYINLITAISQRNPRLVNAIVQRLKNINWGKDSKDIFDVFFKNEFSTELLEDAQLSIKKYIPDQNSRELLYRLSLIRWSFNYKEIKAISEVEEIITHPNEALQNLLYIWIQNIEDSFQMSPLIYDIGENNLSKKVIQNTHLAVARSILSSKKVDQINASRIISSFIKGKDFNNAGMVLLNLYQSAKLKTEIETLSVWGYIDYWFEIDIPKEMSIILRSLIRKEQIRLNQILEKDYSIFENRLEEYVKEDSIAKTDLFIIHFIILINFNVIKLSNFWYHLDYVLTNWEQVETPFKDTLDIKMFSTILWSPIQHLLTAYDINEWLNKINFLESWYNIDFFNQEIAQVGIAIICRNIINIESQKEIVEWEVIVSNLGILMQCRLVSKNS